MLARHRRTLSLAAVGALAVVACSDDDGGAPTSSTAPGPPGVSVPASLPTGTISSSTLPPPADLEALAGALLVAGDVGVPDTWAIRDLDPAIMDEALTVDADPFQGFLSCPDATVRPEPQWLQRTYSAPEQPLDNGLLRVDLIVANQDPAAFETNRSALASCTTTSPDAGVTVTAVEVTPLDGTPLAPVGAAVPGTEVQLSAGPSADVPYPSAYTAVIANLDGRTVTAVVGGIDSGVPFADSTRELVGRMLARL